MVPQAEPHMPLAFPGERIARDCFPLPSEPQSSAGSSLGLSNEMQLNKPGPSMLNLWTADANVSLEKEPVVLVLVAVMQPPRGKKAHTHCDFAMPPTKGLKDFRCIWKLNCAVSPEPASLNTRGTDNDRIQT